MQTDPRLVRWLAAERRQFWLFHGGGFVLACVVGAGLLAVAWGWLTGGWWLPVSSYRGYGYRAGGALVLFAGAWLVMLGRWAAWLWREGWPLARLDPRAGGLVLSALVASETAVPRAALERAVGAAAVERVTHLRGVVSLLGPPASLSLDARLRHTLGFAAPARGAYSVRTPATRAPMDAPSFNPPRRR